MSHTVSVVIPVYNGERTIARALDTVLAQKIPDTQIVVVDDGSTDGTAAIASRTASVTLIRQERQGAAAARNAGMRAATGQYLAFLDADDEWHAGKLRKQLAMFDGDQKLGLVASAALAIGEDGRSRHLVTRAIRGRIAPILLHKNIVVTSSVVLRCACLGDIEPWFRTELAGPGTGVEEWEFWVRMAARHEFVVTSEPLVTYRVSPKSRFDRHRVEELKRLWRSGYCGLLTDPVLGETVARQWRALEANVDFFAACTHYEAGRLWRARREVIRSIIRAPFTPNWKSALAILLTTPRQRDLVRSWLEGR
jgi:glycosyltransferase involved in cell wall biosynthesis